MRIGGLAVICSRIFYDAARIQAGKAQAMPVGAISLVKWTVRIARTSWRQRSGSAIGMPTPLSAKGTVEQSCLWWVEPRSTHSSDGWTKKTKPAVGSTAFRLLDSDEVPIHTITADNGKEFADHSRVAKTLDADFFIARPYHSWLSTEYASLMCRLVPRQAHHILKSSSFLMVFVGLKNASRTLARCSSTVFTM